ncbi:FAD-dependent oxidoreductase [Nocardia sp. NPDC004750]
MFTLRTCDDAVHLRTALHARPKRVLVVGSGFVGSEIALVCCGLGLPVTVTERGGGPLVGVIASITARTQRRGDLRTGVSVQALDGDDGHVRRARLSDGSTLECRCGGGVVGLIRNVEGRLVSVGVNLKSIPTVGFAVQMSFEIACWRRKQQLQ